MSDDGIELATAYVSVTISTRGIGSQVEEQIVGPAEAGGAKAGAALGGGIDKGSSKGIGAAKVALVGLGVAAGEAALKSIESFDKAGEEVKQLELLTGASAQSMSRLRYAAGLMGVDAGRLGVAIKTFSKNAETPAIKKLGLDIYNADGSLKPFDQTILKVADHFKSLPDGATKTALAVQLFGRSGVSMIKMLDQGSAGISDMEKEADKLGVTLTQQNVDMVSKNVEGLKQFKGAVAGVEGEMAQALVPVLIKAEHAGTDFLKFVHGHQDITEMGIAVVGAGVAYTKLLKPVGDATASIVKDGLALKNWVQARLSANAAADEPLRSMPTGEGTVGPVAGGSGLAAATKASAVASAEAATADAEASAATEELATMMKAGTASADELAAANDRVAETSTLAAAAQVRAGAAAADMATEQEAAAATSEGLGLAEDAAMGPLAPLGVALTLGAGLLGAWGTAGKGAEKQAKDLTAAIKEDTGAIGDNTVSVLKNQLAHGNDAKQILQAGLTLKQIIPVISAVNEKYMSFSDIQANRFEPDIVPQLRKEGGARNDLIAKIIEQNGVTDHSLTLIRNLTEDFAGVDAGTADWSNSLKASAGATDGLDKSTSALVDTTGRLAPAIDEANQALKAGTADANQLHLINRTRLQDMTDEITKSADLRSATESYKGAVADLAANQKEIDGTADDENQIRTQAAQTRVEDLKAEAQAVQSLGADQRTYASDLRTVNDDEYQLQQSVKAVAAARANEAALIRNETTLTADLATARKDAADAIISSEDNAEGSALTVEQDKFDLASAEAAAAAGPTSGTTDPNAQAELDLTVKQDKLQLKEATEAAAKATADENTAKKNGIDQAPGVIAASVAIVNNKAQETAGSQAVTDALRSEDAANQTLADGRQTLLDQGQKIVADYGDIGAAATKTSTDAATALGQISDLEDTARGKIDDLKAAVQKDWGDLATAAAGYGLNLAGVDAYLQAIALDGPAAVAALLADLPTPALNAPSEGGAPLFHRAKGGPLHKGELSEVNELGPELWSSGGHEYLMPAADGTVIPHDQLAAGRGGVRIGRGGDDAVSVGMAKVHDDLVRIEALQRTASDHMVKGHETGAGIAAAKQLQSLHGVADLSAKDPAAAAWFRDHAHASSTDRAAWEQLAASLSKPQMMADGKPAKSGPTFTGPVTFAVKGYSLPDVIDDVGSAVVALVMT